MCNIQSQSPGRGNRIEEKNEFEAGFMPFSQGTNQVSGYYGAPVKGSIALDGDKVSINLNEGTICSQWEEQKEWLYSVCISPGMAKKNHPGRKQDNNISCPKERALISIVH